MTRRHARFLKERASRVALKRLKRRRRIHGRVEQSRMSMRHLQRVLRDWTQSRPAFQPVRAKKTVLERIKNVFKPTV